MTDQFIPGCGYPRMLLLCTDVAEQELLIRRIACSVRQKAPDAFRGKEPQAFYKLRYVPPYEKFQELRHLILAVRSAAGPISQYRGILCLDPSEWKGHETEEYFQIILKYLYDNGLQWAMLFVCCNYSTTELDRLHKACLGYFATEVTGLTIFSESSIGQFLRRGFSDADVKISGEALELLGEICVSPAFATYQSLQVIDRIVRELKAAVKDPSEPISRRQVADYLQDPGSSLHMMLHPANREERNLSIENTLQF